MSKKDRPANGTGPNGLRGGRNVYSLKTAVGNWIEDKGGSAMYKRGFHSDNFETECQHQQTGRNLQKTPLFGADLPVVFQEPRKTRDIFNPAAGPQSDSWQTNTQSMLKQCGGRVMQSSNQIAKTNIRPEDLDDYRKSWTNDTVQSREMRFQTESRRAGNGGVTKQFAVTSVRYLPGTPIAFERFRERLLELYGILGMSCVRSAIGNRAEISSSDFYQLVKETGVTMTRTEIQQMLAYLTPTDTVQCAKLMGLLRGLHVDPCTEETAPLYESMLYNAGDGQPTLSLDQCKLFLNGNKYPDIAAGLEPFIATYSLNGDDQMTAEGFALLASDMKNSDSVNYGSIMKDLWGAL